MDSSTTVGLLLLALALSYPLYRFLLPRPIPGIPHNHNLGLLGDIPALLKWQSTTQEVYTFLAAECTKLGSPIIQLFLRPFGRPWIIVCDPDVTREALTRRGDEFDRSAFFGEALHGVLPHNHVRMPTNEKMKAQRAMMNDTMSPSFLNNVAAGSVHEAVIGLMELWKLKAAALAPKDVFRADVDVKHAILDAIWSVALGSKPGTIKAAIAALEGPAAHSIRPDPANPQVKIFEGFEPPETFKAMDTIADSLEAILSSPFPKMHHWLLRQFRGLRKAIYIKERLIHSSLQAALERARTDSQTQSAADLILARALKSGTADVNSPVVRDELFGFLIAGHDTSTSTIAWGLKFLSDNPRVQEKLRQCLRDAWPHSKVPTAQQIVQSKIPYLDAVIEEIARCSGTQSAISRITLKDVRIQGVLLPKGSDVFFMTNGPGFKAPRQAWMNIKSTVPEDRASESWPDDSLDKFWPVRWIVSKPDGEHFVPDAGPSYPFGAGFRGCFGKKLARLELRIFFAVLVCSFELLEPPLELSTYAAADKLNHHPQQCFLRLREIA